MKLSNFVVGALTTSQIASGFVIHSTPEDATSLVGSANALLRERKAFSPPSDDANNLHALPSDDERRSLEVHTLEKRKGGGGRSGGGSSSSGSSSSGSSSSGSSSSGSSSSGSSSGSGSGRGTSGTTSTGSRPAYGPGGGYYAGGASAPYAAGRTSPGRIAPFLVGGAALAFLPFAAIAAGAYLYHWPNSVSYYNQTSRRNETNVPVDCVCSQNQQCGCDQQNGTFVEQLAGNGSYQTGLNNGLYRADNGSLYVDGTIANNDSTTSSGTTTGAAGRTIENVGWAAIAGSVGALVVLMQ